MQNRFEFVHDSVRKTVVVKLASGWLVTHFIARASFDGGTCVHSILVPDLGHSADPEDFRLWTHREPNG